MTQPHTPPPGPFDELDDLLSQVQPATPASQQARAMCTLDRLTHPEELLRIGQAADSKAILVTIGHLQRRVFDRARWHAARHPFEPNTNADENARASIEVAERIFRNAMTAAFKPYPGQLLDLHRFESTFAAWAAGELATSKFDFRNTTHDLSLLGVPDGPNFFCFAESALTFVHMGMSAMFWRPTLRTFVCAAALLAAHHWKPGQRRWDSYVAERQTGFSSATFAALRNQRYAAMDLQALAADFGSTTALALRDEPMVQAFPVPSTPEFSNQ